MCVLKTEMEQKPADTSDGPVACPGGANIHMRITDHTHRPRQDPAGPFKCAEGDSSDCAQSAGISLQVNSDGDPAGRHHQKRKTLPPDTKGVNQEVVWQKCFIEDISTGKNFSETLSNPTFLEGHEEESEKSRLNPRISIN